jgi:hypothetical protein
LGITLFYPDNIEQKIDFTEIREELSRRCSSALGREQVEAMHMETDYGTVLHLLTLTDQMRAAQEDPMLSFPRGDIHDMREAVARIRIEGLFLDETELDHLRKALAYAAELEHFFRSLDDVTLCWRIRKHTGTIALSGIAPQQRRTIVDAQLAQAVQKVLQHHADDEVLVNFACVRDGRDIIARQ